MEDKATRFHDVLSKVAHFVSRDFPEVEEEDLYQDLMVYILERPLLVDPDADYVSKGLYDVATKRAWEYRQQGLTLSPQYSYRTSDVKRILETVFDYEAWEGAHLPEDMRADDVFDDSVTAHSDVKAAYNHLGKAYQRTLVDKYLMKEEVSSDRLRNAIERLTDILNTFNLSWNRDGLGGRKTISNAQAQWNLAHLNDDEREW